MSYKTGGYKTKYIYAYGYIQDEYTIYCAVESCSDICVYKMFDDSGNEHDISIVAEDDTDDYGCYSLIDCLYNLKNRTDQIYSDNPLHNIIIEEMTYEEMTKYFK